MPLSPTNSRGGLTVHSFVFIHGVQRPDEKEWVTAAWAHPSGYFWPRDLVSEVVPNARVMMFGYKPKRKFDISSVTRLGNAKMLLRMVSKSRGTPRAQARPIILVAHCLGGLMAKEVCVGRLSPNQPGSPQLRYQVVLRADMDQSFTRMGQRIVGLMFFGVPHRGANGVRYEDVLANIVRAAGGKVSKSFANFIDIDINNVHLINHRFRGVIQRIQLVTFEEAGLTNVLMNKHFGRERWKEIVLLDWNASVLGVGSHIERVSQQKRAHNMLCKFTSRDDNLYELPLFLKALANRCQMLVEAEAARREELALKGLRPASEEVPLCDLPEAQEQLVVPGLVWSGILDNGQEKEMCM